MNVLAVFVCLDDGAEIILPQQQRNQAATMCRALPPKIGSTRGTNDSPFTRKPGCQTRRVSGTPVSVSTEIISHRATQTLKPRRTIIPYFIRNVIATLFSRRQGYPCTLTNRNAAMRGYLAGPSARLVRLRRCQAVLKFFLVIRETS